MLAFFYKMQRRGERGWSLPEILVGLVIMVVIGAWVMTNLIEQRAKAVDGGVRSDISAMAIAQETWITDHPSQKGIRYVGASTSATGNFTPETGASTSETADAGNILYRKGSNTVIVVGVTPKNNGGTPATVGTKERGYCIAGWNTDGTRQGGLTNAFWYDSALGGMQDTKVQPTGGACDKVLGGMPTTN